VRAAIPLVVASLLIAPAVAKISIGHGELCRTGKGLAVPCDTPPAPRRAPAAATATSARPIDPAQPGQAAVPAAHADRPGRPLIGRGALCRDSKGLAKPCP
jgi:hypothetical protein